MSIEESELKLRKQLYYKMNKEYEEFISTLSKKSPKEIIDSAFEKVSKEDILSLFDHYNDSYSKEQIEILNKCKYPLGELYNGWLDCNSGVDPVMENSIVNTIEELSELQLQKQKDKSRER